MPCCGDVPLEFSNSRVSFYSLLSSTMGLNVCCRMHTNMPGYLVSKKSIKYYIGSVLGWLLLFAFQAFGCKSVCLFLILKYNLPY